MNIAAKFAEKVSIYLNSMNENKENRASVQLSACARALATQTLANPANCTMAAIVFSHTNESLDAKHDIQYLQFLLCL